MATLTQTRNAIDNFITNNWPTVVARQENYRTNRGSYWQGLRTHITTPTYTNSVDGSSIGDNLGSHPTDQFSDWLAVFPEWLTTLLPACLQVDVYNGPAGQGWVLLIEVIYNGNTYQRAINVGPESNRAFGWRQVSVPPA